MGARNKGQFFRFWYMDAEEPSPRFLAKRGFCKNNHSEASLIYALKMVDRFKSG